MAITEKRISEKLRSLGVSVNNLGFAYIKTAIVIIASDEAYLHGITKNLYPTIAKKHNTTWQRVERAIRHAVERTFIDGDLEELKSLGVVHYDSGKMTNGKFLGALYECLKYEE